MVMSVTSDQFLCLSKSRNGRGIIGKVWRRVWGCQAKGDEGRNSGWSLRLDDTIQKERLCGHMLQLWKSSAACRFSQEKKVLMILKKKLDTQKARQAGVTASSISLSSCILITTTTTNIAKNSNPPKNYRPCLFPSPYTYSHFKISKNSTRTMPPLLPPLSFYFL